MNLILPAIPRILAAVGLAVGLSHAATIDPAHPGFSESTFVSGIAGGITAMAWAPDGSNRLFVTCKSGPIRVVANGALLPTPFATLSPFTNSECGVLSVAFDPYFSANKRIYVFYTVSSSVQRIVRYVDANGDSVADAAPVTIVDNLPTRGANHDGGPIGFGGDGKLYWSIGDLSNGTGVDGDLTSLASKIGRANPDGSVASDNPFRDGAGPNNDFIWARGFRNPYTFTFHPVTNALWVNVVGTSWEQVFRVGAGDHAGYNDYENNQPATAPYIRPQIAYRTGTTRSYTIAASGAVRSGDIVTITTTGNHGLRRGHKTTIASVGDGSFNGAYYVASVPSSTSFTYAQAGADATSGGGSAATQSIGNAILGGTFYYATQFPSQYHGNFFFSEFGSGRLMRATLDAAFNITSLDYFATGVSSAIDVEAGPDGALYYSTYGGTIYRLVHGGGGQGLVVSPTALTVGEGGNRSIQVRLNAAPAGNVAVALARSGGDSDVGVSPATLIFTPADWATPQNATVSAAQDGDAGNDTATLSISSSGLTTRSVHVNVTDDDANVIVVSATALEIGEGATGAFTVRLQDAPAGDVTVGVARGSGSGDVTVSGGSALVFTPANYATPQTVSIAGAQDADAADDTATIAVTATALATRTVAVTVVDDDAAAPAITSTAPTSAIVGIAYAYDVAASGNPAPTYSLTTAPSGMTIDAASGVIAWTPAAVGSASVTVRAANAVAPAATQSWTIAVDADAAPTATITQPADGATISGATAEFYGDGQDDAGTVKAEFYVDDVLRSTDTTPGGHYHFGGSHNLFDTTAYSDGTHVLKMVVYDAAGQTGSRQVTVTIANGGLPAPWATQDIGAVAATGSAMFASGTFTVRGSGVDIWGSADEFRFVHRTLSGDGEIRARVTGVQNTNGWAKAGVMIRASLAANARHALVAVTPGNGVAFHQRATVGGSTSNTSTGGITAPAWVRLVRSGDTLTGYRSADGATWTLLSSATIALPAEVQVGLAVTSHNDGTLCQATFTDVTVTSAGTTPGLVAEFFDSTSALSALPDLSSRTPDVTRVDAQINYPSTGGAWSGLGSGFADTFASRHTGHLSVATVGTYTLFITSDDGSKLWLDGVQRIDNDGLHGMRERSVTLRLTAGLHPLRVEFFENAGGAGLTLSWSGPGIAKQVVPAAALVHDNAAAAATTLDAEPPLPLNGG